MRLKCLNGPRIGPNEETVFITTTYDDANVPFPGAVYRVPNK